MDYLLAWIVAASVFFGIVFALFFAIVRVTRALMGTRRRLEEELGDEVLRLRLARGQITQEEYLQARRALGLADRRPYRDATLPPPR